MKKEGTHEITAKETDLIQRIHRWVSEEPDLKTIKLHPSDKDIYNGLLKSDSKSIVDLIIDGRPIEWIYGIGYDIHDILERQQIDYILPEDQEKILLCIQYALRHSDYKRLSKHGINQDWERNMKDMLKHMKTQWSRNEDSDTSY